MKRMDVDQDELPGDTLGVFNLRTKVLSKIPNVKSYKIPEEWGGMVAVLLEAEEMAKDTSSDETMIEIKKETEDNGTRLLVIDIQQGLKDTLHYVKEYLFAAQSQQLLYHTTGVADNDTSTLFLKNLTTAGTEQSIISTHGDFHNCLLYTSPSPRDRG